MDWLLIIVAILALWVIATLGFKAIILHGGLRVITSLTAIIIISVAFIAGASILGDYMYSDVLMPPPVPAFAIYPLMLFILIFWYSIVRAMWKWICK